ncbi:DUF4381 family protein [Candidatus Babeliales bacterium]|nr:DUF4381 family protein [Candidatus Babeliales bacterium]
MNNQELEILDIYDISYNPWWLQKWFIYSVITICIFLIIGISYRLYCMTKTVPKLSVHEEAYNALQLLKKSKTDDSKEFYIQLTTILKQYLYAVYKINVVGATDTELLQEITKNSKIPEATIDHIKQILQGVTFIKFAHQNVAKEQMDNALLISFKIINQEKKV